MRQRFFADNGNSGTGRNKDGAAGQDVVIEVPPGTVVTDAATGERLLDLVSEGQRECLLRGGRGGKGNAHFKSSTHQTPRFSQPGEPGEERTLKVELQIIADIGFVGLPNAGKSTLLKVLTKADPKIGNYPFTTVIPNLGVMHLHDRDIVLADIPGLIAGASEGAGLGTRFLRHIARTRGLAILLDVGEEDPYKDFLTLRKELEAYSTELAEKPCIVVLTKMDRVSSGECDPDHVEQVQQQLPPEIPCVRISALAGENLPELRTVLFQLTERDQ